MTYSLPHWGGGLGWGLDDRRANPHPYPSPSGRGGYLDSRFRGNDEGGGGNDEIQKLRLTYQRLISRLVQQLSQLRGIGQFDFEKPARSQRVGIGQGRIGAQGFVHF